MTSRENVAAVFRGTLPRRVPARDEIPHETALRWRKDKSVGQGDIEAYFDFDIACFGFEQSFGAGRKTIDKALMQDARKALQKSLPRERRTLFEKPTIGKAITSASWTRALVHGQAKAFCFFEPFGFFSWVAGTQKALFELTRIPRVTLEDFFERYRERVCGLYETMRQQGYAFELAWGWGDIAYARGLYFDEAFYREVLYKFHKQLFGFFKAQGLSCVFHSDGNIEPVLSLLKDAGVDAVHPLDTTAMDAVRIKKKYPELVLFGGVALEHLYAASWRGLRAQLEDLAEKGRFIYSLSSPVPHDVPCDRYRKFLETVKEAL